MTRVPPAVNAPVAMAIDGFGTRTTGIDPETGEKVEFLDLSAELVEHSGFVTTLGERVARFAAVRHASYVHMRRLDRPSADRLELVSDLTPGWRLSELLGASTDAGVPIDIEVVIALLRQLLPAVALYGRHNRDAAIGALAVERLIITPQARLVIAEHAFGPALEKLNLGRDKLWSELRVAMPPSAGLARSNQRADANALGVVALSLLLGRVLAIEEYPSELPALAEGVGQHHDGQLSPLATTFANWLGRALQLDERTAFQAPSEAQLAFESVLASDRTYVTSSTKLQEWVATVSTTLEARRNSPAAEPFPTPKPEPIAVVAPKVIEESSRIVDEVRDVVAVHEVDRPQADAREEPGARGKLPLLALGAVIVLLLGLVGWLWTRETNAPRAGEGSLVVQSRPAGARVSVDGAERGVTPVTLRLPSGAHVLEVQVGKSEPRVIALTIQADVQTAQYIELQGVQATGTLELKSQPSGARVLIDGQPRGTTPALIRDLAAGDHTVVVELGGRKATQAVKVEPDRTAQLLVRIPRR
ncbi:MAG: PEGA domain-containing protein [Vicinamibacterales bacterium]